MSAAEEQTLDVVRMADIDRAWIIELLERFGLELRQVGAKEVVPGSYWGDCEAGLIDTSLFWRDDTPVHSVLHEACHFICMDAGRRLTLNRDAGGDVPEENAVCYLQILLADRIPGFGRDRLMRDMDTWGYSFRLGSTRAWFEADAEDAREWLFAHQVVDAHSSLTWKRRA